MTDIIITLWGFNVIEISMIHWLSHIVKQRKTEGKCERHGFWHERGSSALVMASKLASTTIVQATGRADLAPKWNLRMCGQANITTLEKRV
jgi:hypothetical protein